MENQQLEKWIGTKEVSEHLGITIDTIRKWIKDEKIPCHRVGKLWKFKLFDIDEWVKSGQAKED